MTSVLVKKDTVYHNQFKCNYLKNQKDFGNILLNFWNVHKILNVDEPHSLSIFEIIDSKRRGFLNA